MKGTWGGDILRLGAAELAEGGLPAARTPGEVVTSRLRGAGRDAMIAETAVRGVALLQDTQVADGFDQVGHVGATLMRTRVRLACEAAQRGLHLGSGFGLVDWLAMRCPDLDGPAVRDLAKVASAGSEPVHAAVVGAVLERGLGLARAARLLRSLQRVRGAITTELYADLVTTLVDAACDDGVDDAALGRTLTEMVRRCLREKDHDEANKARRSLRDLHESSLADGSVKRIIMTFGDDGDYEAVRAILTSPLAAPASQEEQEATGVVDTRTPGQRRYDAFLTVLRRGVAGTKGEPTTSKAALVVSLDFEVLRRMLSETTTQAGCGSTLDGATVTAETIRRLACEADLIPVVLGSEGEVLDQGRAKRLVTPGQRIQLARRDQCCTIPGCSVPATWCDAHHVVWWSRGGKSDVSNYALLCPRHHTWVHDNDLTATVTAFGVTWHLR
ncbi:HNH endonuclease signature motif containing protein [Ornithinimicrobium flavum]|uniref:HNH endonuclease signature motif containing protein n=1 Tax=Ornithinimicrobium flavum TaxID=1288636 RepID=UPI0013053FA8|nr:HNH endonuclease signature motif containing protein [Ornithinimicrobium flavum]